MRVIFDHGGQDEDFITTQMAKASSRESPGLDQDKETVAGTPLSVSQSQRLLISALAISLAATVFTAVILMHQNSPPKKQDDPLATSAQARLLGIDRRMQSALHPLPTFGCPGPAGS